MRRTEAGILEPLPGSKVAWQEGIATYLEQVALTEGNLAGKIPGMPADATNMSYDSFQPALNVQVINPTTDFSWSVAINNLNVQVGAARGARSGRGFWGGPTPGNPPVASRAGPAKAMRCR